MGDNLKYWNLLKTVPAGMLKPIMAGRLKGKSDINPQWRMEAMTSVFGPVGKGWRYEIVRLWTEPGTPPEVCAFALVNVYVCDEAGIWSEPIPGIGGSMLIEQETRGPHTSDEAYKMAVTDALSVALKALGVAADVYMGLLEGSKYSKPLPIQGSPPPPTTQDKTEAPPNTTSITVADVRKKTGISKKTGKEYFLYTVIDEHGKEYKTFSESLAKTAKQAKESGIPLTIEYTTEKFGNDIVTVTLQTPPETVMFCPKDGQPIDPTGCPLCPDIENCSMQG